MAKKTETETSAVTFDADALVFDLSQMRARDMSVVSRGSKSWDEWADLLARAVVSAPGLSGNVSDRESWLDLLRGDFEKSVQAVIAEISGKN
jgi:hypothetical protein